MLKSNRELVQHMSEEMQFSFLYIASNGTISIPLRKRCR